MSQMMARNSKSESVTSGTFGPMLLTETRTSWHAKDRSGVPVTSFTTSPIKDLKVNKAGLLQSLCRERSSLWGRNLDHEERASDRLDGVYAMLLMRAQNRFTEPFLNPNPNPISPIVAQRRVSFAGHCYRAEHHVTSDVSCWRFPWPNRGQMPLDHINVIGSDTQHEIETTKQLSEIHYKAL